MREFLVDFRRPVIPVCGIDAGRSGVVAYSRGIEHLDKVQCKESLSDTGLSYYAAVKSGMGITLSGLLPQSLGLSAFQGKIGKAVFQAVLAHEPVSGVVSREFQKLRSAMAAIYGLVSILATAFITCFHPLVLVC